MDNNPLNRWPNQTLLFVSTTIALYFSYGPAAEHLVYVRQAIVNGEWWRFFTTHWIHSHWEHLLLDSSALLILSALLEKHQPKLVVPTLLIGTIAVNGLLWWLRPDIQIYCGLSGILHSLFLPTLYVLWQAKPS